MHGRYFLRCVLISTLFLLETVVSLFLLTFVLGPFLLIAGILNEAVRLIITVLFKINSNKGRFSLVSDGADNLWNFHKLGNNRTCVIAIFSKISGNGEPPDLGVERECFLRQVFLRDGGKTYSKMRKAFVKKWGYDCLKEAEDFDMKNHIRFYRENELSRVYSEDEFLQDILPELSEDMEDPTKPQWEEVIIPKVKLKDEKDPQCVRCFRYHHGYMDGITGTLMFSHCLYQENEDGLNSTPFPYVINPLLPPSKISSVSTLLFKFYCFLLSALTMVKSLYTASAMKGDKIIFLQKTYKGRRIFGWSEKIDASLLSMIKGKRKISLSAPTILATAAARAILRLQEKQGIRSDPVSPSILVLGVITALIPYRDIRPRNNFTLTHVTLPLEPYSLTLEKVKGLIESKDPSFFLNRFMFSYFGRFPSLIIKMMMRSAGGNPVSFSNVPLTKEKVNIPLFGDVEDMVGWPPLIADTGMGIIITKYSGHIKFLAVADEAGPITKEELDYVLQQVGNEIRKMAEE